MKKNDLSSVMEENIESEEYNEEEEIQKSRKKRNDLLSSSMLSKHVQFKGLSIRPVTLSSLAILEKLGSSLLSDNASGGVTDALVFLWAQSEDLDIVLDVVSSEDPKKESEQRAIILAESLDVSDLEEIVGLVSKLMSDSTNTKVLPIKEEDIDIEEKESKNK